MTKRLLQLLPLILLLAAATARGQISGAGQLGCPATPISGTVWNSGTSLNATQVLLSGVSATAALVQFNQTTTITAGAGTFQLSYDGTNWISVPVAQVLNPATGAQLTNPYTFVASTNQPFLILLSGATNLRLLLGTQITGSGSVTPFTTSLCVQPTAPLSLDAMGLLNTDLQRIAGTAVDVNSGNKSAGTQRFVLATDQPNLTTPLNVALAANQSANVAQINGVTPLMGNGVTGTGSQRVTLSSDNSALPAAGQGATAAAVPSGATYLGANGSGNLTGIIGCDNSTAVNMVTATTTQIIAISGTGGRTYICSINLVTAATNNVALVSGSGTNCASNLAGLAGGTTAATGWNFAANGGLTLGNGLGMVLKTVTTNNEVCLVTSAATQLSGSITWTQF